VQGDLRWWTEQGHQQLPIGFTRAGRGGIFINSTWQCGDVQNKSAAWGIWFLSRIPSSFR
jgi:hypothetical protein